MWKNVGVEGTYSCNHMQVVWTPDLCCLQYRLLLWPTPSSYIAFVTYQGVFKAQFSCNISSKAAIYNIVDTSFGPKCISVLVPMVSDLEGSTVVLNWTTNGIHALATFPGSFLKTWGRREPWNIHWKTCQCPAPGSGSTNQTAEQNHVSMWHFSKKLPTLE